MIQRETLKKISESVRKYKNKAEETWQNITK
mgnify:CR=1 FL=1